MRIAVDVMGGDNAPDAILAGCLDAVELLSPQDQLVLVGDERVIRDGIAARGLDRDDRLQVLATSQVIAMDESPVQAIRTKTDSSIVRMSELGSPKAGENRCDIVISAGNTGACVASAQMTMRRLPGVHRPGIAVTMPTFGGPVVVCDVGANPEPKPHHLHQYGHMASEFCKAVVGVKEPRVALMSIGGEEGKGNALVRETHRLIKTDNTLNYVGFVEGRELFERTADVVLTEGFTGNVVLKLSEGLAAGLFATIGKELAKADPQLAQQFKPIVGNIYRKHDYHEAGGAPLLGANGVCIICHGSSEARTIKAAIRNAMNYANQGVNARIVETLGRLAPVEEGAA